MRIWPKAVVLLIITLWFGFVRAEMPDPTTRLRTRLTEYYGGRPFSHLQATLETGVSTVSVLLASVLEHVNDTSRGTRARHRMLLNWAAHLSLAHGPIVDQPLIRAVIADQLTGLFAHFTRPGDERVAIKTMFRALELWEPAQLPSLALAAGAGDDAEDFGLIALHYLPDEPTENTRDMATALRQQTTPLNDVQELLLARSGYVRAHELARMILTAAHDFASAEDPYAAPTLIEGSPFRELMQDLSLGYREDFPLIVEAFEIADEASDKAGDRASWYEKRLTFFEEFKEGRLFGETPEEASDAAAEDEKVPVVPRVPVERDGNVLRVAFGRPTQNCQDAFGQ